MFSLYIINSMFNINVPPCVCVIVFWVHVKWTGSIKQNGESETILWHSDDGVSAQPQRHFTRCPSSVTVDVYYQRLCSSFVCGCVALPLSELMTRHWTSLFSQWVCIADDLLAAGMLVAVLSPQLLCTWAQLHMMSPPPPSRTRRQRCLDKTSAWVLWRN